MTSPRAPGRFPMLSRRTGLGLMGAGLASALADAAAAAAPAATMNVGVHVSLPPAWFDPGEAGGLISAYMLFYAMHDALMKPMREANPGYSLAEAHSVSPDRLTYEFLLREGTTFHDGSPVTADDAMFTFERYRGHSAKLLQDAVAKVEAPDARRLVIRLKAVWPDFMTFLVHATGAGWVVPRKYVEKVGDAGFKKAPIGAGPFKFVSFTPGVELVLAAHEGYWRRKPSVERIVMRVIPEEATRLAALKRGELDFAYSVRGEIAQEVKKSPGLKLEVAPDGATYWMCFPEQWDEKSPWFNPKVRRAASLALDYPTINEALNLGYSRVTSNIIPQHLEFHWKSPPPVYDPRRAKALLAEAGYPTGFDAGTYWCDSSWANIGEAAVNYLGEVGIRARLSPIERVAFDKAFSDKRYRKGIIQAGAAAFGNAATRLALHVVAGAPYGYGTYPEIEALYAAQQHEGDVAKRSEMLHEIQRIMHAKDMFVPIWQLGFLCAAGPRLEQSQFGVIPGFVYQGPLEDIVLKRG